MERFNRSEGLKYLPIPERSDAQITLFTKENLHATQITLFNPFESFEKLKNREGAISLVVDIGGTGIESGTLVINKGYPSPCSDIKKLDAYEGAGHIKVLEEAVEKARAENLPVGFSYGAPLENTMPLFHPKLKRLYKDLKTRHNGDFKQLFSGVKYFTIENDAVSGIKAGSVEAVRKYGQTFENVLYIINGGGVGAAVLKKEGDSYKIIATEPGHIELTNEINPHGQNSQCNVNNNSYVCIENVVASGKGIEELWKKKTGNEKKGKEISILYQEKNKLATQLYENSARGLAHVVVGVRKAFDLNPDKTIVVYQGGIFKTPEYGSRVKQLVNKYDAPMRSVFMPDVSSNASRDGAAISAIFLVPK